MVLTEEDGRTGFFDGGAAAASRAASAAFFRTAPVAVVTAGSGPHLAAAGEDAARLGIPLLQVDDAAGEDPAARDGLRAELDRLGTTSVLTYGTPDAGWEPVLGNRELTDDAGALPDFAAPAEKADAVFLSDGSPLAAAAEATARAAGATVLRLPGGDPRADPDTVALLHGRPDADVFAAGEAFGTPELLADRVAVARTGVQLPGGGQTVFPQRRMVALYGHPGGGSLGVLGEQGIAATIQRAKDTAAQYQPHSAEPVIPALEIIATVASAEAGPDGNYSRVTPAADLLPWIEAAEAAGVYVVLDLQPGRSTFMDQAKTYTELLQRPSVGLALDAEWRLAPGQRHMEQIGSVDAGEINATARWLAELTREHALPQKVFMLHQFNTAMITNRDQVDVSHDELAVSLHADGHGTPGQKLETWNTLLTGLQPGIWPGWKNFYDEDLPTLTPEQTYTDVSPKPWFISYQ
ncbi:hypothetical protein MUK71_08620 [Arthrobacter zhangbolii]|uniref:Lipoprotein n=1 Tax=Arthrobacter zhangbolii TaxID=2886936 RepID=A0A9X1M5Z8_9MICC|nr:hypothetical protein [Arthrobacter zhangbolii]MCC3271517.1 hypothetical protein [Arthrobacter zhangbolii]MCC3293426.1 hypothetical protein [Arthrobacter zhangbolii]UON90714.1 hypothetical protein MUK71_08620 [Arthrobacter zhangbolii]